MPFSHFSLSAGRAVHLVVIELVLFEHLEALGRQRDLGIEIDVAPLGVHVRHAEEADIIVITDILRQRALVLAHMPLADALGDIALVLQQQRHGDGAVETARLAIHRRPQDAVMQRILAGMDGGAGGRAGRRRIGRGQQQTLGRQPVHHRRGVADRDAAAVEAGVHPADIVHQKDHDVGLLAGLRRQRRELVGRRLVLLGMLHRRVHIVGGLDVLNMHILLGMAEAGRGGGTGRGAANILGERRAAPRQVMPRPRAAGNAQRHVWRRGARDSPVLVTASILRPPLATSRL